VKATLQFTLGFILSFMAWMVISKSAHNFPVPNAFFNHSVVLQKEQSIEQEKKRNRVLFVGGSNVTFGINAAEFEKETGIPAVNFGCVAGMGPEMILYKLKPYLQAQDTVVMAWEYGMYPYSRSNYVNVTYLNLVFGPMAKFLESLPLKDQVQLSLALPAMTVYTGIYTKLLTRNPKESFKAHWVISSSGDLLSNHQQGLTEEALLTMPMRDLLVPSEPSQNMREVMIDFLQYCAKSDITVISTWPNLYRHPKYLDNQQVEKNISLIKGFWESLGIPVAGHFENALFQQQYIHNTPYHLNQGGAMERTKRVIEDLKPFFPPHTSL